ncbi:VanZ family protein [Brachybacterium squillarum]|uniref:VanZ family protein n=1 Tax=Brachybacterium squillarum TaxID=661979 RepID=UPI0022232970|nr:VanZ family protein [Brachybacterium squillarum]MCW1806361.1 VanZ family protein [Brachybacterium squillarum]
MNELARLALVGVVGGLGVFVLISPVAVLLQRRRFGRWRPLRLIGVAAICVYTMALAGLTVAPAYEVAVTCSRRVGGELRAVPFHAITQIIDAYSAGTTGIGLLIAWPTLQLIANIVLFVPLGAILRGVFRLDVTTALAMGVMLSVLIEATQYTGAWGLYPCGVRIADIDDVFSNSLGAWIGAMLAPLLTRLGVPLFGREERHWSRTGEIDVLEDIAGRDDSGRRR